MIIINYKQIIKNGGFMLILQHLPPFSYVFYLMRATGLEPDESTRINRINTAFFKFRGKFRDKLF